MKKDEFTNGVLGGLLGGTTVLVIGFVALLISPLGERMTMEDSSSGIVGSVAAVDVADVVSDVNTSVVSIVITKDVPIIEAYYDDPFLEFFGRENPFGIGIPQYRENGTEEQEVGAGSGFVVSEDGFIVTNAHVVDEEDAYYTVFFDDGTSLEATLIAADEILDIAVLKVEANDLPYLEFGDSDALRLGEGVIAIGNALGEFGNSVSTGVISGLSRTILASDGLGRPEELEDVLQTDAAINPGNSGGPLINFHGEVIGVNVAVASGSENIGFAIPSNSAKVTIEQLKEGKPVERPFLGVRYRLVDEGAEIITGTNGQDAIYEGSPADEAGLQEGDVITEVNGDSVDIDHDLSQRISAYVSGDEIELKVLRDGEVLTIQVILAPLPN